MGEDMLLKVLKNVHLLNEIQIKVELKHTAGFLST